MNQVQGYNKEPINGVVIKITNLEYSSGIIVHTDDITFGNISVYNDSGENDFEEFTPGQEVYIDVDYRPSENGEHIQKFRFRAKLKTR